jgi:hypothetical protein
MVPLSALPPASWVDVVILPGIAVFFGMLFYSLGFREMASPKLNAWRVAGIVVLFLGALAGFGPFWSYIGLGVDGELYRGAVIGRKMMLAHLGAFGVPAICLIGIGLYEALLRRRGPREEF